MALCIVLPYSHELNSVIWQGKTYFLKAQGNIEAWTTKASQYTVNIFVIIIQLTLVLLNKLRYHAHF